MDQIKSLELPPLPEKERAEAIETSRSIDVLVIADRDAVEYPSGYRRYAIGFVLGLASCCRCWYVFLVHLLSLV